jgi:uncharacterized protein YejL (UPF0352 family)
MFAFTSRAIPPMGILKRSDDKRVAATLAKLGAVIDSREQAPVNLPVMVMEASQTLLHNPGR